MRLVEITQFPVGERAEPPKNSRLLRRKFRSVEFDRRDIRAGDSLHVVERSGAVKDLQLRAGRPCAADDVGVAVECELLVGLTAKEIDVVRG